jgi:signal transduction histidine kinase
LLRSPADIQVLAAPSWWTARRLAIAVSLLLGVATIAVVWIALLRRRLGEQAEVIRDKIQRAAALEERHRMAREMHDTLAQSFSGLGFQLDALGARLPVSAEPARAQLDIARQMVRHGQEGFRRSLLNLRAQELERGTLAEALPALARQITAGTGIELRSEVYGVPCGLPEAVEANLLRIGQECLANAVHHGHPRHIDLVLSHEPGLVKLRIADDGEGFDPRRLTQVSNGHFGWRGIRERAEQIRATVNLDSQPGRGTAVTINVLI